MRRRRRMAEGRGRRLAVWSGPRMGAGALMAAFAARPDCAVLDRPFLAPFLAETGREHPMREAILADGPTDPDEAAALCLDAPPEGRALLYQRHEAAHMLPGFPRVWMEACANVFVIRSPMRVAAEMRAPCAAEGDLGFGLLEEIFRTASILAGSPALVIDAADVAEGPEAALRTLCARAGIGWRAEMLAGWRAAARAGEGGAPAQGALREAALRAMPYYARLQEAAG